MTGLTRRFRRWASSPDDLELVRRATIELRDPVELTRLYRWTEEPIVDTAAYQEYRFVEDVNDRRLRDAQVIATIARNTRPQVILDIGTSYGHSAALLATNAPDATVVTVNIAPEAFEEGGVLTTGRLSREDIGRDYRERGLHNVQQVYANTATWEPDIGLIDIAFIDGSHDTDFVVNDTVKALRHLRRGGFVLWHDFNPSLADQFHWIEAVCRGVGEVIRRDLISGRLLHVRDSWVGIYRDSTVSKRP